MKKTCANIRKAVAIILAHDRLRGVICTYQQLAAPIMMVSGCYGLDGYAAVNEELILSAFRKSKEMEHIIKYDDMLLAESGWEGRCKNRHLLCRVSARCGKSERVSEIGCFVGANEDTLNSKIPPLDAARKLMDNHPLDDAAFRREIVTIIPDAIKDGLEEDLKKVMVEQLRNKKRNEDLQKKAAAKKKRKNSRQQPPASPAPASTDQSNRLSQSTDPDRSTRRRKGSKSNTPSNDDKSNGKRESRQYIRQNTQGQCSRIERARAKF